MFRFDDAATGTGAAASYNQQTTQKTHPRTMSEEIARSHRSRRVRARLGGRMFRSAVLEPSIAVEFGDMQLLSARRMDCLDREPEAETRHDSTRPFVLGFVDADDLIEDTLLKPVVLSFPSGLGGISAAAERFAEPPPDLNRRQNLRKEPWHPQASPAGELPHVTKQDRRPEDVV